MFSCLIVTLKETPDFNGLKNFPMEDHSTAPLSSPRVTLKDSASPVCFDKTS
jgi:hypothetical protein